MIESFTGSREGGGNCAKHSPFAGVRRRAKRYCPMRRGSEVGFQFADLKTNGVGTEDGSTSSACQRDPTRI